MGDAPKDGSLTLTLNKLKLEVRDTSHKKIFLIQRDSRSELAILSMFSHYY